MSTTQVSLEQHGNVVNLNLPSSLVSTFVADLLGSNPGLRIGINCLPQFSTVPQATSASSFGGYVSLRFYGPRVGYGYTTTNDYNSGCYLEKIKAIKAVREVTSLGLTEAKAFVEGGPKNLSVHSANVNEFITKMHSFGYDVRPVAQ